MFASLLLFDGVVMVGVVGVVTCGAAGVAGAAPAAVSDPLIQPHITAATGIRKMNSARRRHAFILMGFREAMIFSVRFPMEPSGGLG
jgi:hypothetical protein